MLSSRTEEMTLRKMTNMTVAMTEATVQRRALMKVRMAMGRVHQRERIEMGIRKMRTKERQAEVRKKPNMTLETILMRSRMSLMSDGRLTIIISVSLYPLANMGKRKTHSKPRLTARCSESPLD